MATSPQRDPLDMVLRRSARPAPCRRSRRSRSCRVDASACGRPAPRIAGAKEDRRRSSARRRWGVGVMDERAAHPSFCRMPPEKKAFSLDDRETVRARCIEEIGDAPIALGTALPKKPCEELDVLAQAEIGIEIPAEALQHVGDARAYRRPVPRIRHIRPRALGRCPPARAAPRR